MAEIGDDAAVGYNIFAPLGKGKAIMGLYTTSASGSDTITTPFIRCVPVLSPAVGQTAATVLNVTEAEGVVTITSSGASPTGYQVIIIGDMYGTV